MDLGSLVLEESGPRDTRMRIDRREPKDEDEQREFHEILEQFKRGIDENLDTDDYQAHYDLGVAFKEMGLLDEAIAEFQKALRAPDGRLRTSEALGIAFFEKGQFTVSESVLRRAVESVPEGDDAKIGLLYWLGRACEAQGKDDRRHRELRARHGGRHPLHGPGRAGAAALGRAARMTLAHRARLPGRSAASAARRASSRCRRSFAASSRPTSG